VPITGIYFIQQGKTMNTIDSTISTFSYPTSSKTKEDKTSNSNNGDIFLQNVMQALNDTDFGTQDASKININGANQALNKFESDFNAAVQNVQATSLDDDTQELSVDDNDVASLENDVNSIITNLGGTPSARNVQAFLANLARNQMLVTG
jgi:hypothetical protein